MSQKIFFLTLFLFVIAFSPFVSAQVNGTANTTIVVSQDNQASVICNAVFAGFGEFSSFFPTFFVILSVIVSVIILTLVIIFVFSLVRNEGDVDSGGSLAKGIVFGFLIAAAIIVTIIIAGVILLGGICGLA